MTAQFAIRPAVDSDMDKLPDIERSAGAAFRDVPGLQWIADDDVMSAERHRELAQSGAVFVAEDGAQNVVAFISCEILFDRMHIWELAVHSDAQRAGLGRRMVQTAIDHARDAGLTGITFTTFRDVAFNAPFYEQLGFRIVEDGKLGPWLSAIIENEVANGLPRERRCAMELRL